MHKLFYLLSLLMAPFVANANFMIYPISKDLKNGNSELVRVYSKSKEIQYIKIYTKKIINPGTTEEYEVDIPNWDGGLVVTPQKVILPAGASKSIRLTQFKIPKKEEVYRVYFEAVKPDSKENVIDNKKLTTELSVNIIYAALIKSLPSEQNISLNISRNAKKNIIIYNNGNVRAGVKDIYFCKSSNIDDNCVKKAYNKNIYPEKSFDTLVNNNFSYVFIKLNHEGIEKEQGLIQLKVP